MKGGWGQHNSWPLGFVWIIFMLQISIFIHFVYSLYSLNTDHMLSFLLDSFDGMYPNSFNFHNTKNFPSIRDKKTQVHILFQGSEILSSQCRLCISVCLPLEAFYYIIWLTLGSMSSKLWWLETCSSYQHGSWWCHTAYMWGPVLLLTCLSGLGFLIYKTKIISV